MVCLKWRTSYFGRRNRHGSGHEHRLAGFSASSGENVAVAVPEVTLYPAVLYSRINPPLEIAVPNLEELVPSQKSFNGDIVFREHHEDLPCGVIIGLWSYHQYFLYAERTISLEPRAGSSSTFYPRTYREFCWFHASRRVQLPPS